jgi:16S rRNA (cytidine1402-2'-O)-methyltransferase
MDKKAGLLYLVATPIGNLGDISARAIDTIKKSDIVAAEDTRHTGMLMKKLGVSTRLESYHEHNKAAKGQYLLEQIKEGLTVALVSDAGMPCISDPGNDLVKLCTNENIAVVVIPGPCAAITAVSGSDIDTSRFVFEGFIPVKGTERKSRIQEISDEKRTVVIYEAPHRMRKTLKDLSQNGMGQRRLTIARELTKMYEEFIRLSVDGAIEYFSDTEPRGEFVIVIEGRTEYLSHSADDGMAKTENLDKNVE